MHGIINRSIECFITHHYGSAIWADVVQAADLSFDHFEAMLPYSDKLTERILDAACAATERDRFTFLEDMGTFMVSNPSFETVRRLLRFGGTNFTEFLMSLDDLNGRAMLALPDLEMPQLAVTFLGDNTFNLAFSWAWPGFAGVAVGILRAMADDFGALVLLDVDGDGQGKSANIKIALLMADYAAGKDFSLSGRAA